jgi:hypothetical protein
MADLLFNQLPLDVDEGLPQRFAVGVGDRSYDITVYANVEAPFRDPPETIYEFAGTPQQQARTLVSPVGYLVLRVDRRAPDPRTILLRKLVVDPDLVHEAHELAFVVKRARVARGNLNGRGRYGSDIVIGVARRWV